MGLERLYEEIRGFHRQHGRLWEPAPLLEQLARSGRRFRDLG